MQQNYSKSFTMDAVADAVHVSRRLLEMRFRAERKTSPAMFLFNLRLQKAKIMLAATSNKATEQLLGPVASAQPQICGQPFDEY
jgi:transcriptional regulator GlxA family with amidase domain